MTTLPCGCTESTSCDEHPASQSIEKVGSLFNARLRIQAENITHEVFGYPASAAIGRLVIPLREAIAAALLAAHQATGSELRAALAPFAAMDRPDCDLSEVACDRGVASDKTIITSGDFRRAALALVEPQPNQDQGEMKKQILGF